MQLESSLSLFWLGKYHFNIINSQYNLLGWICIVSTMIYESPIGCIEGKRNRKAAVKLLYKFEHMDGGKSKTKVYKGESIAERQEFVEN